MLYDMHVHSQNSHDSTAAVCDVAAAAIQNGVSLLAITDHCDIQYRETVDLPSVFAASVAEAKAAAELCADLEILTGIEVGEGLWDLPYAENLIRSFPFDVVVGSVHAVRYEGYTEPYSTIDFSEMPRSVLEAYLDAYFDDLLETVETLDCDIVAHLTCPFRYVNGKFGLGADPMRYRDKIGSILDAVVKRSLALEVNTSGIGTAFGELRPPEWVLRDYRARGGELVTLGSDAHVPERTGNGFGETLKLLKRCGFDSYFYYKARKAYPVEIP